jgi:hypothetical protein
MTKLNPMAEWNRGVRQRRKGIQDYERKRKVELSDVKRILVKGR